MKGFSETRGQASRLEFDQTTGQFISKPIAHGFAAKPARNIVARKLVQLRQSNKREKLKHQTKEVLTNMSPQARDDLGMTEHIASISQS